MTDDIKVSVCVVTYNQEKYIAECLQSLVDQKTDFAFEIIVSDDCSTDSTRPIISSFACKYPEIVTVYFQDRNVGGLENFIFAHKKARGKYVAHMDGDDYALPNKLQTQANIMDKEPDCNILWTPVYIMTPDGGIVEQSEEFKTNALSKHYYRSDLIKYGTVGTNSSKMYRRGLWFDEAPGFDVIDYYANVEQIGSGYARFSGSEPLGVYRSGIGIASSNLNTRWATLNSVEYFIKKYPSYRRECNFISLLLLLSDIKNYRSTLWLSLRLFLKTISLSSLVGFFSDINFVRSINVRGK